MENQFARATVRLKHHLHISGGSLVTCLFEHIRSEWVCVIAVYNRKDNYHPANQQRRKRVKDHLSNFEMD